MLGHQLLLGFWFYLIFSLCSGIGLLLTWRLFPGKAISYFLAKALGWAAFAYVIWLLSSLNILNYQNSVFLAGLFIVATVLSFAYFFRTIFKTTPKEDRKRFFKNVLWLELLSLGLYYGYLYLRSFNAAAYGTERFMDMMLLNATMKAQHFPFIDSWYAGKLVNYYYYGHYMVSVLTRLSGITSFLTYNYSLGLLYSSAFLLAALFVYELTRSKFFAFLGAFLVTTAGSMFYSGCVISTWMQNKDICSYASSTRLYTPSYIINEIPSYSFTVGDLHAHFQALPFFLVNMILAYLLVKAIKPTKVLAVSLLLSLTTSALVNPSDVTSLAVLLTIVWLYRIYDIYNKGDGLIKFIKSKEFRPWAWLAIFLIIGTTVLYLPFLLHFVSPVLGFGFAPLYALKHHFLFDGYQYPTPPLALLGMWGVFVFGFIFSIYYLRKDWREHFFIISGFITSAFLIVFVELFFVEDIYSIANPPYFRANTVFKYGYHTWILLSIVFSVALAFVFKKLQSDKRLKPILGILKWILVVFIFLCLIYPYQAVVQFYLPGTKPLTLNAIDFMQTQSPGDLATINYMNQNFTNREVVLEAAGDSYTYFARMSVFTGNIAPIGWMTHEWTWRFDGKNAQKILAKDPGANVETGYGPIAKVSSDVELMYTSTDISQTEALLKQYGIEYVYIGDQERTTYPTLDETKFSQLGHIVFQADGSELYEIN